MALRSELKELFGKQTLQASKELEPKKVDALAVQKAAGAFLRLKGQPSAQMELVNSMHPSTAAALCRWIADPSFWGLVSGVTKH